MKTALLYIALTLIGSGALWCQSPSNLPVTVTADTLQIRIGEPITLTLQAPKEPQVYFPPLCDSIGKLQLINSTKVDSTPSRYRQQWQVTAYDSGRYTLDSLPFLVRGDTFYTKPLQFQVYGVVVDTTKQKLYDIKPLYTAPYTIVEFLPWILGGLLLIALLVVLLLWLRKRKRKPQEEEAIVLPPHVEALNRLRALDEKPYLNAGDYKAYYSELTEILRHYFERRYAFPALEYTSGQILAYLKREPDFPKTRYAELKRFLKASDLVKFAKKIPQRAEAVPYRKQVAQIVLETRPWQAEGESPKDTTAV